MSTVCDSGTQKGSSPAAWNGLFSLKEKYPNHPSWHHIRGWGVIISDLNLDAGT
jgi:hypothetical protein